jgi:hypothetical protein
VVGTQRNGATWTLIRCQWHICEVWGKNPVVRGGVASLEGLVELDRGASQCRPGRYPQRLIAEAAF